mmetsp:Transcript_50227/g.79981  ORF Transcript_50227/g.79981 Transcript_50227/m.79981 type:complete len:91 (+) Transcript_50227:186-458(+)
MAKFVALHGDSLNKLQIVNEEISIDFLEVFYVECSVDMVCTQAIPPTIRSLFVYSRICQTDLRIFPNTNSNRMGGKIGNTKMTDFAYSFV